MTTPGSLSCYQWGLLKAGSRNHTPEPASLHCPTLRSVAPGGWGFTVGLTGLQAKRFNNDSLRKLGFAFRVLLQLKGQLRGQLGVGHSSHMGKHQPKRISTFRTSATGAATLFYFPPVPESNVQHKHATCPAGTNPFPALRTPPPTDHPNPQNLPNAHSNCDHCLYPAKRFTGSIMILMQSVEF
eukprot:1107421-Prorocentrum_minimum.AAC.4